MTMAKPLTLSNSSLPAIVDAEDWHKVSQYPWFLQFDGPGRQSCVRATLPGGGYIILHRFLMEAPPGVIVDHRDGDVLNNRRSNLRPCTHAENMRNSKVRSHSKSGLRNVGLASKGRAKAGKLFWRAIVTSDGKKYRRWFPPAEAGKDAAIQWVAEMRIALHGEFAFDARHK